MSIKLKLYGGFGVLVILALGLVLYGVQVFDTVGYSVTRLNGISENATRTLQIEDDLEKLSRSVLRYAFDHDAAARKENGEVAAKTLSALQAAEQATPSDERKKMYQDVRADLASTQQSTQLLFQAVQEMDTAQPKMLKTTIDMGARLSALVDEIKAGSDQSLIDLATKLEMQFGTVRVLSLRAQLLLNIDSTPGLADAVAKATASMTALEAAGPEHVRAQVGPLKSVLADFHTAIVTLIKQLHESHDLYIDKIVPQIGQMQATIAKLTGQLQENFGDTRTSVETSIVSTVFNQKVIGGLVLLIGGLIAFFIARSVSNPIAALTEAMRELAKGNFDVVLPGLARKDEIGNIAKAVDEFKVKAAENAALEAAAKAEQDKRADAERQSALAKMSDEFQATVGGIVEAAAAGDFSRRVTLDGATGLVLNVGTLINSLCDNVGKALGDLVQMLSALAEGNLSERIVAEYQGDFAALKDNANTAAERIGDTIAEI